MKFRNCKDCGKYKYIKRNGKCPTCCREWCKTPKESSLPIKNLVANEWCLGEMGSGKTFASGLKMVREKKYHGNKLNILAVDPYGGLKRFCESIGADSIDVDSPRDVKNVSVNGVKHLDLKGSSWAILAICAIDTAMKKSRGPDEKTIVYIDGAGKVVRNHPRKLQSRQSKCRSYSVHTSLISQEIPKSSVLANARRIQIHRHPMDDKKDRNSLGISKSDARRIRKMKTTAAYSEAMIKDKSGNKKMIRIDPKDTETSRIDF